MSTRYAPSSTRRPERAEAPGLRSAADPGRTSSEVLETTAAPRIGHRPLLSSQTGQKTPSGDVCLAPALPRSVPMKLSGRETIRSSIHPTRRGGETLRTSAAAGRRRSRFGVLADHPGQDSQAHVGGGGHGPLGVTCGKSVGDRRVALVANAAQLGGEAPQLLEDIFGGHSPTLVSSS